VSEKPQTIFRAIHCKDNPYFQMLRATAQDQRLSFEARGVMVYLLSKPNNWEISKKNLMSEGNLGRTKMDRIIDELTQTGYLTYTQEQDKGGKFTRAVYTLYEEPQPVVQNAPAVTDEPVAQNVPPAQENEPVARKPRADNDHQHNIENTESTDSKDSQTTEKTSPTSDDVGVPDQPTQLPPDSQPAKPPTEHRLMFQAVCDALGLDPIFLTEDRRGTIGKTASQIRKAHGTPAQIPKFMRWLRERAQEKGWDDLTENAMRKYWGTYASEIAPKPPIYVDLSNSPQTMGEQYEKTMAAYNSGRFDEAIKAIVSEYEAQKPDKAA